MNGSKIYLYSDNRNILLQFQGTYLTLYVINTKICKNENV